MLKTLKSLLVLAMIIYSCPNFAQTNPTAGDIVSRIKENLNLEWHEKTEDTFKAGDESKEVTGIITTFTSSYDVLKKAKELGCNLIISHEPTYYHGSDDITQLENNPVLLKKKKFIEDNNLTIWRFHDHWHMATPDGITDGMIKKMGWQKNLCKDNDRIFLFEETTLQEFAQELQNIFPDADMKIIGNPKMKLTKVGFIEGAPYSITQMKMLERDDVELLVAGETREWETTEYARDAVQMGFDKAFILLGHAVSEEAGMDNCAEWLKEFVDEVPIYFVPAGDPYWSL